MIEIELKFEIKSMPDALKDYPLINEKSQKDIYYDNAGYDLLRGGNFLRVRNDARIDFKFDMAGDGSHEFCSEVNFNLDEMSAKTEEMNKAFKSRGLYLSADECNDFADFIARNGLTQLAVIDKHRREYEIAENLGVAIDEAKGMGLFLEAEMVVPESTENADIQKYIRQIKDELSVRRILTSDAAPVNIGYVELYLQKHNRAAYDLGMFKL
jgi:adenylate cyclase class IV